MLQRRTAGDKHSAGNFLSFGRVKGEGSDQPAGVKFNSRGQRPRIQWQNDRADPEGVEHVSER